ncbi:unnamed protein product [Haemonchus placei]|uniref:DLH domain-containing protein n=1 Tax=Haemonchus placei TaxID=6290 RepID=A0A0N4WUB5_HAEPC|nr:unnamed protein product [Haemonchus placei]
MTISKDFEYKDADGETMKGVLHYPKNITGKLPAVLVLHAFGGCGEFESGRAAALANLGFVALAADVYGKGKKGGTVQENFALMKPLVADRMGVLKKRLLAAVEAVRSLPEVDRERIGAIGYCFGGLCALDLARHNVGLKAAVSFHGTLTPIPDVELVPVTASIQVHHGDADIHIPATAVNDFMQEMRTRKADWSFTSYGNAEHGFTEPHIGELGAPGVSYNKEADRRSWAATVAFLKERLEHS